MAATVVVEEEARAAAEARKNEKETYREAKQKADAKKAASPEVQEEQVRISCAKPRTNPQPPQDLHLP